MNAFNNNSAKVPHYVNFTSPKMLGGYEQASPEVKGTP